MADFQNILVTGGAGFIGSHLVKLLVDRFPQASITNLDVLTYAGNLENVSSLEKLPNYSFVKMDICDTKAVESLFAEKKFDLVFHLAAESHVDRSILGPKAFVETNVMGTTNLLQAAKDLHQSERSIRFVHVSTDEVYGSLGAEGKFERTSPYDPKSPYSASKAASDHLARAFAHTYGMDVLVTNCSNNYGPNQFPEKLIPLVINNCVHLKPIPVYGKGDNVRDWIHVRDHALGLIEVAVKGKTDHTYLLGSNNEWQNIDLVHKLCDLVDEELERESGTGRNLISFVKDRAGHDQRYAIDNADTTNETGWEPGISFEDGLRETVKWYLNQTQWLDNITSGAYLDYYKTQYNQR